MPQEELDRPRILVRIGQLILTRMPANNLPQVEVIYALQMDRVFVQIAMG